jgi:hypothetical protein
VLAVICVGSHLARRPPNRPKDGHAIWNLDGHGQAKKISSLNSDSQAL